MGFFSLLFALVGKALGQPLSAHAGTSAFLGLIMYQMPKRYLNISFFSLGIEKLSFWKNEMPLLIFPIFLHHFVQPYHSPGFLDRFNPL